LDRSEKKKARACPAPSFFMGNGAPVPVFLLLGILLYVVYLAGFILLCDWPQLESYKYVAEVPLTASAIFLRPFYRKPLRRIGYFISSAMIVPGAAVYIFLVPMTPAEAVPALGVFLGYCLVYVFLPNAIAILIGWIVAKLLDREARSGGSSSTR
jgi:hypothetical protein